jgi:hypothetical protein
VVAWLVGDVELGFGLGLLWVNGGLWGCSDWGMSGAVVLASFPFSTCWLELMSLPVWVVEQQVVWAGGGPALTGAGLVSLPLWLASLRLGWCRFV